MHTEGIPIPAEIKQLNRTKEEKFSSVNEKLEEFSRKVSEIYPVEDARVIEDALMLMMTLHIDQADRPNGNPYVDHVLSVAQRVLEITSGEPDKDLVVSALLHDSVEDQAAKLTSLSEASDETSEPEAALKFISDKYGNRVADTVDHLSNPDFVSIMAEQGITQGHPEYGKTKGALYSQHVREATENPDVFVVKLADIADHAESLRNLPDESKDQRRTKRKFIKKYLPVMQIFSEKLAESGKYPEIKELLDDSIVRYGQDLEKLEAIKAEETKHDKSKPQREAEPETLNDFVNELMDYFNNRPVEVLPKAGKITAEQIWQRIHEKYPDANKVIVCDFPVEQSGDGQKITGGLQFGNIINIDHHHDMPEMKRHVSSTNLAIEWVKTNGIAPDNCPVVINHLDTDSFLSACIVRGFMAPEDIYGQAAIAADHTGEANEIADFFNPMDQINKEGNEKFHYILRNWLVHLIGDSKVRISKQTRALLTQAIKDRAESQEMVESGKFQNVGSVYWAEMDKGLDSSFFPALLPEASIIATFYPNKSEAGGYKTKLRLGNAAPDGFDLLQLGIGDFDPNFGGRWNAGSNSRGGGTQLPPERYVDLLSQKTEALLQEIAAPES